MKIQAYNALVTTRAITAAVNTVVIIYTITTVQLYVTSSCNCRQQLSIPLYRTVRNRCMWKESTHGCWGNYGKLRTIIYREWLHFTHICFLHTKPAFFRTVWYAMNDIWNLKMTSSENKKANGELSSVKLFFLQILSAETWGIRPLCGSWLHPAGTSIDVLLPNSSLIST